MKIAVLGTGRIGGAVVRRLLSCGFEPSVWNRTRHRAEVLGAPYVADSPAAAVRDADVVLSVLTGPEAVRDVYLGALGALDAPGSRSFLEMSTTGPAVLQELDPVIRGRGSLLFDAPVLGSVEAAESGKLVVLLGGDHGIERVTPVLEALGEIRRTGALGSAARLKLVSNSMLALLTAAAAELLAAGAATTSARDDVYWALQRFAPYIRTREAGFLHGHFTPVTFALRDMVKDLDLALELFSDTGSATPLTATARDIFVRAAEQYGDLDVSAVVAAYPKATD